MNSSLELCILVAGSGQCGSITTFFEAITEHFQVIAREKITSFRFNPQLMHLSVWVSHVDVIASSSSDDAWVACEYPEKFTNNLEFWLHVIVCRNSATDDLPCCNSRWAFSIAWDRNRYCLAGSSNTPSTPSSICSNWVDFRKSSLANALTKR